MKAYVIALLLLFVAVSGVATYAEAEFDVPHIKVLGTAETKVVPNELHWSVSVNSRGQLVEDVSKSHGKDVAKVLKYLHRSGIDDEDVKTSRMQLKENWVYRNNNRLRDGYFAFTSIDFKTVDFTEYQKHWEQLATFNNLTINGVQFDISNRIEIQNETRILAVKKARAKAKALAEAVDAHLLEPLLIAEVEGRSPLHRNVVQRMEVADSGGDSSISAGQESVRVSVRVLFRISTN